LNDNKNIDHIYLDFDKIIKKDKKEFMRLFSFLNLNDNNLLNKITNENLIKFKSSHHKNYQIKKLIDENEIPFMKKYYQETI
jgi:hypothetical protein